MTQLVRSILETNGWTYLLNNWVALYMTLLDLLTYICNTYRWLYLQYNYLALYMTTDRFYMKLIDDPVIDKTGSPYDRTEGCPVFDPTALSYIIHTTRLPYTWRLDFFNIQNIITAQTDGAKYVFHKYDKLKKKWRFKTARKHAVCW